MKKSLIVLGGLFLLLVVVVAVLVAYAAFTGNRLDEESKAYVDTMVPTIVLSWNQDELMKRASAELKQAIKPADMDRLFQWFRTLGQLQQYEGSHGQAMDVTPQTDGIVSSHYFAKTLFEHGEANIEIALIKHANEWENARLKVDWLPLIPPPEPSHGNG